MTGGKAPAGPERPGRGGSREGITTLFLGLPDREERELLQRVGAKGGCPVREWHPADPLPDAPGALLVLDTRLGGGNAYELARRAADRGGCRVLLVGPGGEQAEARALAGFVRAQYLGRPLEAPLLEAILGEYAQGRKRPPVTAMDEALQGRVDREKLAHNLLLDLEARAADDQGGGFIQALTDPETGLFNRPFMAFRLDEEVKRARRFAQPLTIVLLEIHLRGEEAPPPLDLLLTLSGRLLTEARDIDSLGRWSGTGLLLLLPGTPAAGARVMLERVLQALPTALVDPAETGIAVGMAALPDPRIEVRRQLLVRAEEALAAAGRKIGESGRFTALVGPGGEAGE